MRRRERLDQIPPLSPEAEAARQRIDEWEQRQYNKLNRGVEKAREELARAEQSAQEKLKGDS